MRVFITGEPGVGKTTLFFKVVEALKENGISVGGFYCPEVREGGTRVGFRIVDLETGKWEWLARVDAKSDIKVGKYYVLHDAEKIVDLIRKKISNYSVIAIDEIGPMELSLPKIKEFIDYSLSSGKHVFAVVHRKIRLKGDYNFVVTVENRNVLLDEILKVFQNVK